MKKIFYLALAFLLISLFANVTILAAFPEKPLNYVVCFNPGGESDLTARAQQQPLEEVLGVDVVVSYKIGGGGAIGWAELVKAKPDGYHTAGFNLPHIILQPMVRGDAGYETKDIKPVYIFQATPCVIAVRKDSPFQTVEDLVEYAKEHPGAVTIGGSSSYSANHLGTLEFNQAAGIRTTYIPFTGSGDAVPSLLGGHVSALMTYTTMGVQYSNEMKVLAVASEERVPSLPDVPTFKELGYDYVEGAYRGLAVPPGTPDEIVAILAEAVRKVNQDPDFRTKLEKMGFQLVDYGPEKSQELIDDRIEYYKTILVEVGLL